MSKNILTQKSPLSCKPTLIKKIPAKKNPMGLYECPYCKKHFKTRVYLVEKRGIKSCGCASRTIHGEAGSRLFRVWTAMKERCLNKNCQKYHYYGGRGIAICNDWMDAEKFIEWAKNNGYSDNLTIDRRDSDKGYNPENCRFVTRDIQARNKRMNKNNTSGYRGVSWHNGFKRYCSRICVNYKSISMGNYKTAKEAAIVRDKYIVDNNLPGYILNFK